MTLFSERYKYVKPHEVLLRECFPTDIANGVCSCYDGLEEQLGFDPYQDYGFRYIDLEEYLWGYFQHKRKNDSYEFRGHKIVATTYLNALEKTGIVIPKILMASFIKLYAYTNQPDNGIRHALMDEDGKYVPGQEEALFMLVSCSSFLNYLKKKE